MALKFWLSALDFVPNSNFLPNGDMETDSYWQSSGDQTSMWYDSGVPYYGSRSLAFQVIGPDPITDITTYSESKTYQANSYGCKELFDGFWQQYSIALSGTGFDGCWAMSFPGNSEWFQTYHSSPIEIKRMRVMGRAREFDNHHSITHLQVEASNVGSFQGEQSILLPLTAVNSGWAKWEWETFSLQTTGPFNFYRTYCKPQYSAWMIVAEVEYYEW